MFPPLATLALLRAAAPQIGGSHPAWPADRSPACRASAAQEGEPGPRRLGGPGRFENRCEKPLVASLPPKNPQKEIRVIPYRLRVIRPPGGHLNTQCPPHAYSSLSTHVMHSLCSLRSPQRSLARASLQSPRLLCSVRSHASPCHTPAARFACLGPCLPARVAHRLACCCYLLPVPCLLLAPVAGVVHLACCCRFPRHLLHCCLLRSRLVRSSLRSPPRLASLLLSIRWPLRLLASVSRFARRASPAAARFARRSPARAAPPRSLCSLLQHFWAGV